MNTMKKTETLNSAVPLARRVMPFDVRARCLKLRCDSKRGVRLHPDDMSFLNRCFKDYPKEYGEMEAQVFDETKPYGAA